MGNNSKDDASPMEENSPASGDETDISPPPDEPVTESGDFPEQWIETKCVFCGIELKDFHEPKLLQCLHTACKTCLSSESASSPAPTSSGLGLSAKQLFCPSCNQDIMMNEVIDHLFLMEHLSQTVEGLPEESKSYPCSCDEGAEATGFCTDCQEWLCDACVTAHHRVRVTKDHVIRPKEEMEGEKPPTGLSQKYLFCPHHSHEPLKLYCESCDKLTCRDCQLSDHKEHKYQFLTSACEEEKSSLSLILAKIKEKQQHIETACSLVNKRHEEITQRELAVTQEIKTFAVKFITEINKRGKQLLQELAEVCSEKKTQLSFKNQELLNMTTKLSYCKKFAEAALSHGSETALVYSKKVIIGQLKRILKHRCEVPNPSHNVDIMFSYEGNYLTQYISQLGTLLVDQHPVPRVSLANTTQQPPQHQPSPQQQPPPNQRIIQQSPVMHQNSNMNTVRQMSQQLVPVNRNNAATLQHLNPQQVQQQQKQQQQLQMQKQQQMQMLQKQQQMQAQKMQLQQKQPQQSHYGQPQVTSSTDHAQNRTAPQNNMRQMNANNQVATYSRNQVPRNMPMNMNQNQSYNVANSSGGNNFMQQRHVPQQSPIRQPAPQPQQPTQQFNQQPMQMPQMLNSNITISPIGGPTPPKQRAMTPRQSLQMSPINNQKNSMQRVGNVQQGMVQQQQQQQQQPQRGGQPQVIEIDADGPHQRKTPTMSNTNRLSHFPAAAQAAIAANPGLQIQPINTNSFNNSGSGQLTVALRQNNTNMLVNSSLQQNKNALMPNSAVASLDEFAKSMISDFSSSQESKEENVADSTLSPQFPSNPPENQSQKNTNTVSIQKIKQENIQQTVIVSNTTSRTIDQAQKNVQVTTSVIKTSSPVVQSISAVEPSSSAESTPSSSKQSRINNSSTSNVIIEEPLTSCESSSSIDEVVFPNIEEDSTHPLPESSSKNTSATHEPKLLSKTIKLPGGMIITCLQDVNPSVNDPSSSSSVKNNSEIEMHSKEEVDEKSVLKSLLLTESVSNNSDNDDDGLISINEIFEGPSRIVLESAFSTVSTNVDEIKEEKEEPLVKNVTQSDVTDTAPLQSDPNDDYCAVCHDGGDLLCCSKCPRVYHVTCHVPSYPKIPSGEWFCRMCEDVFNTTLPEDSKSKRRKHGIDGRDLIFCERILLELYCHSKSPPFHNRISKSTPGYYAIIKYPMDLSFVRLKLSVKFNDHYQSVEEYISDLRLMFSNCRLYNGKGSPLFDVAVDLEKFLDTILLTYFPNGTNEEELSNASIVQPEVEKEDLDKDLTK